MTCEVQRSGDIELLFYGELQPAARARIRSHLKRCGECRQGLEDLHAIRAALASVPDVAAPPAGDWSGFMNRLDAGLRKEIPARAPAAVGRMRRSLLPALAAAGLLLAALGGWALVRQNAPAPLSRAAIADPAQPSGSTVGADEALVSLTGQHFERSKLVVLGITTRQSADPGEQGLEYERELADALLGDTRVYRQAAEARGMDTLAGVMRDLEFVLLQTSMAEPADPESLEQLQQTIRRRDLLTKMNAVYTRR